MQNSENKSKPARVVLRGYITKKLVLDYCYKSQVTSFLSTCYIIQGSKSLEQSMKLRKYFLVIAIGHSNLKQNFPQYLFS